MCQVRDARNPIVSCVAEPSSGHELNDPDWYRPTHTSRHVLIVGGGPAGLEAARVAATRGHHVTLIDTAGELGGIARVAGPGRALVDWLIAEVSRLGVRVELNVPASQPIQADGFDTVIKATGSRPGRPDFLAGDMTTTGAGVLIDVADLYRGKQTLPPEGTVVILDPIGGPIGVALAESLGARAVLITPDNIAGNELSRTGDLAPANVRLAQNGVHVERRSVVRGVSSENGTLVVLVQDRFSGVEREIQAVAVVDAGFRLPNDEVPISSENKQRDSSQQVVISVGDCVAPRTILEAILEGRRAALHI